MTFLHPVFCDTKVPALVPGDCVEEDAGEQHRAVGGEKGSEEKAVEAFVTGG